jgi:hypothetical protein
MDANATFLTLGQVAKQIGIKVWKVRRVYERGLLAEPSRIGGYRVVTATELPTLLETLRAVGYMDARLRTKVST